MLPRNESTFEPIEVLLDCIQGNPYQPRLNIDKVRIQALADSIREQGLQQPPQARKKPSAPGQYELVFGHRRTAAFRLLRQLDPSNSQWQRIPLFVVPSTFDNQRMFEAAISENFQREDIGPISKARALDRYIQEFRASQIKAGRLFGLTSQGAVSNTLRLLKLPNEVKDLTEQGVLNEYRARQLLRLNPEDAILVARELAKRGPELRDTYYRVHFPIFLSKVEGRKSRSRRTAQRETGRCPSCKQIPTTYAHTDLGWKCSSCGATVKVVVKI